MDYYLMEGEKLTHVFWTPLFSTPATVIPNNTKIIGKKAFAGVNDFSNIIIPPSVEEIDEEAFLDCTGLKEIIIPETVKKVKAGAFKGCLNLQKVTFSYKTSFANNCFSGCQGLKSIQAKEEIAKVFYYPHRDCFAITIKQDELSTDEYDVYAGSICESNFPAGQPDPKAHIIYFVVIHDGDKEIVWHDHILDWAIEGAKYFASGRGPKKYFYKQWTLDSTLTMKELSLLLGIGREEFSIEVPDNSVLLTVREVLGILNQESPFLYERLLSALEEQDKIVNFCMAR